MLAILSYHKIGAPSADAWETWYYVSEATLADQLRALQRTGWQFVDAATVVGALSRPDGLPERAALVTFDDGYRSLLRALPLFAELACPAVVFVPTAYIGDRSSFDVDTDEPPEPICGWDELRELERAGVSVQSHGHSHRAFSELAPDELEHELSHSKAVLEEGLDKSVDLLAFPYGDPGADHAAVRRLLERTGYRAAFLFEGGPTPLPVPDLYALPRVAMWPDTDVAGGLVPDE